MARITVEDDCGGVVVYDGEITSMRIASDVRALEHVNGWSKYAPAGREDITISMHILHAERKPEQGGGPNL